MPVCPRGTGHLKEPHWDALLDCAVAAARSPLVVGDVSGEWVPWPKGSGVDLVDLYMCRIKAQREDSTIEYLVQLFDSIAIAALIDLLS